MQAIVLMSSTVLCLGQEELCNPLDNFPELMKMYNAEVQLA